MKIVVVHDALRIAAFAPVCNRLIGVELRKDSTWLEAQDPAADKMTLSSSSSASGPKHFAQGYYSETTFTG